METQQPLYAQWGTIHKIWFRFVSAYIVIYIFPFPANLLLESVWYRLGGHKTVIMYPYKDSTTKYQLTYQQEGDVLELYGKFHNYYLYVKMKRSDEKNLLLINRGFHWINEMPFSK